MLTRKLQKASTFTFVCYAGLAAFLAYASMYGFRKPFTAAEYEGLKWLGIDYKILLVCSQVFGYAASKFFGISFISSIAPVKRSGYLLFLLGLAQLALLGFAVTPYPYKAGLMLVNGLPLGLIWGLVFGFLEGRRTTELLAAILSVNFILSSGLVKSLGKSLVLEDGVSEWWMPFVAGLYFTPILLLSVWMLSQLPPPDASDLAARKERRQMTATDRWQVWYKYWPGFTLLMIIYLMLTIVRDIRDNFAVELWAELGYGRDISILTTAEIPIALLSLLGLGGLYRIKNNYRAFVANHLSCFVGVLLLLVATQFWQRGWIGPVTWMTISGFGLFFPYILFNGVLFDRFIGAFNVSGNVGFLIYLADSIGYLGAVGVLLWKSFSDLSMRWIPFYVKICYGASLVIMVCVFFSYLYFSKRQEEIIKAEPQQQNAAA